MYSVLILPMRNGNIKKSIVYSLSLICSYPTYEEWKLKTLEYLNKVWLCSYPTYEEWKQTYHLPVYPCFCKFLSYLWGMETENKNNDWYYFRIVLILPMRNGNAKLSRYNSMIEIVLILPMRNGNYRFHLRLQWTSFQFLSYLWGMETHFHHHCCYHKFFLVLILPMRNGNTRSFAIAPLKTSCSYPTYEEWKQC